MVKRVHEGYRAWSSPDLTNIFTSVANSFPGEDEFDRQARSTVIGVASGLGIELRNAGEAGPINMGPVRDLRHSGWFARSNVEITDIMAFEIGKLQDQGLDVNTPQGTALLKIARRFRIIE